MEQGIDRGRTTSGLAYTKGKQSQSEHGRGVDGNVFGHENGGEFGGVGRGRGSWCCCGIIHRSSVVVVCYPMQLDNINNLTPFPVVAWLVEKCGLEEKILLSPVYPVYFF